MLAWHNKTFHYLVPTSTHLLFNYFQLCRALQNCQAPCPCYFLFQNILLVNSYSSLKTEMLPLGIFPCSKLNISILHSRTYSSYTIYRVYLTDIIIFCLYHPNTHIAHGEYLIYLGISSITHSIYSTDTWKTFAGCMACLTNVSFNILEL